MNEVCKVVFGLAGGLALFLYGMNSMSDALQKAAGEKMKKILEFLTKNPIMGVLAGALVTAVLQSSSATTVMVIGFVSAGLMSLPQAISVIFGANIGTTMTAQLMAFKITDYIYPIIFVGFMLYFASKKEKVKNVGLVIFSFGLLFEGIEIMGSVMKPLANSPIFVELMAKVSDIPVLGVLLGAVMTLVVQSSSATIAVLQNFASQPGPDGVTSVIGLAGAIPILFGDNIGTTITALLASIGQSKNAKRTALAHSIFNITGSIVFLFLIPVLAKFVQFISPKGPEVEVISRQIANAHTTFNVVCTLVWLPLIPVMVKIVTTIVRGDDTKKVHSYEPQYLDDKMINQPIPAMYMVSNEINRIATSTEKMLKILKEIVSGDNKEEIKSLFKKHHDAVKTLQDAIVTYISKLFTGGALTEVQAERVAGYLAIANNIDRIADRCGDVVDIYERIGTSEKILSDQAKEELAQCVTIAEELFEQAITAVATDNVDQAEQVIQDKKRMRKAQKKSTKKHLERLQEKQCDPELTRAYSGILLNLDRVADNCTGIAEEALDRVTYVRFDTEENAQQNAIAANA
ncbi:Na/Pi cotransporter family protein [Dorea ammoniilytica]|uniref:Na/Pi cotransporter family protein n=1 Tax=Dorea ammoniilytica TaxID=2981788 RepID=A0ABT2S4Z2_9FIRM|nr:Na/Pi cotransporter family protein [Dorea ammoniilytica]MCU6699665.1 Na/Pi cotransporter family protein [Dorea ammoniilytica]SCH43536.1 Na/Pi-cotransporter II-related protein [uncultured Eubacterium sp.]